MWPISRQNSWMKTDPPGLWPGIKPWLKTQKYWLSCFFTCLRRCKHQWRKPEPCPSFEAWCCISQSSVLIAGSLVGIWEFADIWHMFPFPGVHAAVSWRVCGLSDALRSQSIPEIFHSLCLSPKCTASWHQCGGCDAVYAIEGKSVKSRWASFSTAPLHRRWP